MSMLNDIQKTAGKQPLPLEDEYVAFEALPPADSDDDAVISGDGTGAAVSAGRLQTHLPPAPPWAPSQPAAPRALMGSAPR